MNAVVIEHVPFGDLPLAWRAKASGLRSARVKVLIEEEDSPPTARPGGAREANLRRNPLVGMWRDRAELADVGAYVRALRDEPASDADLTSATR